jgi:hypothetical protein
VTVTELREHLAHLEADGQGDRIVRMGDPRTNDYEEVTGLWIPTDEAVVDLESVAWMTAKEQEPT